MLTLSIAACAAPGAFSQPPEQRGTAGSPAYSVRHVKVGQAWCTVAIPHRWARKLLIYAHGYRPDDAPLAAPLHAEALSYRTVLEDGWIVAATSYRRNGHIPAAEAIDDVDALREYVTRTHGAPERTLLLGAAEGGDIVTRMAERSAAGYQGALAVGALDQRDKGGGSALTFEPRIPLLFLSNASSLPGPLDYVKRAARAPVAPVLWTVRRPGDLNVNQQEVRAALEALIDWTDGTRTPSPRDATYVAPRSGASDLKGTVLAVNRKFGNLTTSFTTGDMDRLGIGVGDTFALHVEGKAFQVRYVTGFGDVQRGEWLALAVRSGLGESQFEENLTVGVNGGSAADTSGADVGAAVRIAATGTGRMLR